LDRRDAECLRQCNDQIGGPGMPSWNAGADHCHGITASSSVLCRAERSTQADGVRKPVSGFSERVLSGLSGIECRER
jgi:hypothetical protein